jgi:putative peptide zinc metalloprotease protein
MDDREPLQSPHWYRVSALRPRLRAGLHVSRQVARGEVWIVVLDPASGRAQRFSESGWALVAACDGERTVDAIWHERQSSEGDGAPTQGAAMRVLRLAHEANLFAGSAAPDADAGARQGGRLRRARFRAGINPLAFRIPLWDPDAILGDQATLARLLGRAPVRLALWVLLAVGALLLLTQAGALAAYAEAHLASTRVLLAMWLAYPVMKALHELAHACMVKAHGGEVHEVGVSLLLLTPVPYVDASASVVFPSKGARVGVAAAGIVVEALLATLALALWMLLEDGLAREVAFAAVLIGGVSTLLVNGNPLLRFDGYFVFTEAMELPNLAARSVRWWKAGLKRLALGRQLSPFGARARGELPWLVLHAPLAWAWRTALLVALALLASAHHALAGLAVIALAAWWCAVGPLAAAVAWLGRSPDAGGRRARGTLVAGAAVAALAAAVFLVPLPQRSHAPGLVWLPDDAIVRVATEGIVDEILVADGDEVAPGTPLLRLSNEPLRAELARVQSQIERFDVERANHFGVDAARAVRAEQELERLRLQRDRVAAQVDALIVRAAAAGRVALDGARRDLGRWLPQGHELGVVLAPQAPIVRAMVRNEDIALVREQPGQVRVAVAAVGVGPLPAEPGREVPRATRALPSAALGEPAGGSIPIDPADAAGRTARDARFQLDLVLPPGSAVPVGTRALVTFTHGSAPLAALLGRELRQAFLRHFPT